MKPQTKQVLSALVMAVAGAAATAVEQAIANPPFTLHSLLNVAGIGAMLGLVHFIPTLGTKDVIAEKVQESLKTTIPNQ